MDRRTSRLVMGLALGGLLVVIAIAYLVSGYAGEVEPWSNALAALAPTILVGLVFWFIMAAIIRSDRSERSARAKIEAEERAKRAKPAD